MDTQYAKAAVWYLVALANIVFLPIATCSLLLAKGWQHAIPSFFLCLVLMLSVIACYLKYGVIPLPNLRSIERVPPDGVYLGRVGSAPMIAGGAGLLFGCYLLGASAVIPEDGRMSFRLGVLWLSIVIVLTSVSLLAGRCGIMVFLKHQKVVMWWGPGWPLLQAEYRLNELTEVSMLKHEPRNLLVRGRGIQFVFCARDLVEARRLADMLLLNDTNSDM